MSTTPEALTQFDYLLNAMTHAALEDRPAEHDYKGKRHALYAHVRRLEAAEAERDQLREVIEDKNAALDLMRQGADQLRAEVETLRADAAAFPKLRAFVQGYSMELWEAFERARSA